MQYHHTIIINRRNGPWAGRLGSKKVGRTVTVHYSASRQYGGVSNTVRDALSPRVVLVLAG